jgi:hypothetical protein
MEAAVQNEVELIKKKAEEVFRVTKDLKELGGEHVTNLGQNFNAIYVQGNKDVNLLDNTGIVTKDTAFLTTILQDAHILEPWRNHLLLRLI